MALAALLEMVAEFSLQVVETLGYPGVFLLMVMESMVFPVPSEAVLPPAGWLVYEGKMDLWIALLVATLGTLVGSLLSYAMGYYGLRPFLERYGKYVFVSRHHLDLTHAFFEKRGGGVAIFLARFVPVVRHLISIPAGSARMPLATFSIATIIGGGLWNLALLVAGYKLGENWHDVTAYIDSTKWTVLALVLLLTGGIAVGWWLKKRKNSLSRLPGE